MSQHTAVHKVLVVEHEAVIAMDITAELNEQGLEVAGPFSKSGDAMIWLASGQPDYAIIDAGFRDGAGFEVARELRRRGVRFVFFSATEDFEPEASREWHGTPWVGRPTKSSQVVRILTDVSGGCQDGGGQRGCCGVRCEQ